MHGVNLDTLYLLADLLGARLEYKNLHARHPQLEAYTQPPAITLDKSLRNRIQDHRVVLAHELGHIIYPPRPGHTGYYIASAWGEMDYSTRDNLAISVAKDERLAMKFATELLIPDGSFCQFAAAGPHQLWEWLEAFDVPQWFFEFKAEFIRAGQSAKWRDWLQGTN